MKVLISADMEGTCGVVDWVQVNPPWEAGGGPRSAEEYATARRQMTDEVAAAIRGAFAGGATGVTVNDSHDGMKNLILADLPRGARMISGFNKSLGMVQGVQEAGVGAVFFTGYHGKAGTPNSVLAHSFTLFVKDIRLDGLSTGEFGVNAAIAGHFGVPVVLVTGGDICIAQVRALLGDGVAGAEVKQEISFTAANHLHPVDAVEMLEVAARDAMRLAGEIPPYRLRPNCRVEVDLAKPEQADLAAGAPGVERLSDVTLAFNTPDAVALMDTLMKIMLPVMGG